MTSPEEAGWTGTQAPIHGRGPWVCLSLRR